MSTNVSGDYQASPTDTAADVSPVSQLCSLVSELADRVNAAPISNEADRLADEVDDYIEREVERRVDERLADVEDDTDDLDDRVSDLEDEPTVEYRSDEGEDATVQDLWIGPQPVGKAITNAEKRITRLKNRVDEEVDDLRQRVVDEEQTRAKEDGKVRRRLSHVEDEIGISPPDAVAFEEGGEDAKHLSQLERLIRHGPDAVTDGRVYPVHERAREIALHFGEWGKKITDANGKRIRLRSKKDDLKTHLQDVEGERLRWEQVYRALEKLDELADGSALKLVEGEKDEGKYVLELKIADGRGPSFAKGGAPT